MKIVNLVLTVMFLLFAFVQINDPDPVRWILIYGSMAVVCALAAFRHYYQWPMVALLVIFVVYSYFYIPSLREWLSYDDPGALFDNVAKMEHLYIEESREFLGLWICNIVLIIQILRSRRVKYRS